jgi:hypothetical protein
MGGVSARDETLRDLVTRLGGNARVAIDPRDVERLTVPDTVACREAERVCREASSPSLANHCFRSYAWGALLGAADGIGWDAELFYVASMLHDIGLTPAFDRGGCFESDGAEAAREILAGVGWASDRSGVAAEAIYLHMHEVTGSHSGEAQLLALGTTADVSGGRALEVAAPNRELVLSMFPRLGFKREFIALFEDQARRKPNCVVAQMMAGGAAERILAAPYDE